MTKTHILILLMFSNFFLGQNKQFFYEYKFILDSTKKENVRTEMMVLNIQKEKYQFYSFERYTIDSTMLVDSKKGLMVMSPNKETVNEIITKYPNSNKIVYTTFLIWDKYRVKQDVQFDWKLTNEFSKILNYEVQKATTEYGGRKWTAWFTKEIPIPDGPYKFKNLPGLIVKIEDSHKNHVRTERNQVKSGTIHLSEL